ncbi:MAG: aspartyl protease family protein [Kiritimatiellia bacterium]|jgi:aspartyl protease family protein
MVRFFMCVCLLIPLSTYAVESVELKGIFGKRAVLLVIDGKQTMVKIGKAKYGVALLEVDGTRVFLDVNGERQQISLTKQRTGSYKKPSIKKTVRIASKEGGHYWIRGAVNSFPVDFLVDTGASTISMNASVAKRLGVDYRNGRIVQVSTANGLSEAAMVNLKKVSIGEITQYNIAASIMLNDSLPVVLLGNSFLGGVDLRTDNGVLVLESKL